MLYSEIKSKYKDEFVLLGNPKYNGGFYPETAELVFHDKEQERVRQYAGNVIDRYKTIRVVYTGDIPEAPDDNFAFIL